jgi:hypothetical protein
MVIYESVCKFGGERGSGEKWLSHLAEERSGAGNECSQL